MKKQMKLIFAAGFAVAGFALPYATRPLPPTSAATNAPASAPGTPTG